MSDKIVLAKPEDVPAAALAAGFPEFIGHLPVRTEITVLPADQPSRSIGFMMHENIGVGIVNPRAVKKGWVELEQEILAEIPLLRGTVLVIRAGIRGILMVPYPGSGGAPGGTMKRQLFGYDGTSFSFPHGMDGAVPGKELVVTEDGAVAAAMSEAFALGAMGPDDGPDESIRLKQEVAGLPLWGQVVDDVRDLWIVSSIMLS